MFKEVFENITKKSPLIHNITNYVTVNDCANILLAAKASPIMADEPSEAAEITSICSGLNINIGTLNERTIKSMFISGERANDINIPVLLDPVGAGASTLRTNTAKELIEKVKFSVIRGNVSEIKTLACGGGATKGVDAAEEDAINNNTIDKTLELAVEFAKNTGAVIVITGKTDIVTDGEKSFLIYNGNKLMSSVTGTGCMLSALMTAFIAANDDNVLDAAAAAVCTMGLCGEKAIDRMTASDGNSSYRNYIIDAIFNLRADELERGARYEIR